VRIFKLSEKQIGIFDEQPEVQMGVQTCVADEKPAFVLWGRVLCIPDVVSDDPSEQFEADSAEAEAKRASESWLNSLKDYNLEVLPSAAVPFHRRRWSVLKMTLGGANPTYPGAPMPLLPAGAYGHLPYMATTGPDDVFYRCEPFSTSPRVLPGPPAIIKSGTFAAPISELPFMTTGFSILGRYAIPGLLPACYRWEIQPEPTQVACGLSVPLYGYGGGGVEVAFTKAARNRGPIANPVKLQPF
jgi:hypothetical protein